MTPNEANEILEMFLHKQCDLKRTEFAYNQNEVWQAVSMASDALEKQIPKKPIDDRYPWCICPVCGGSVYLKNVQEHIMNLETTHCEHCGQALDWGDGE